MHEWSTGINLVGDQGKYKLAGQVADNALTFDLAFGIFAVTEAHNPCLADTGDGLMAGVT